MIHHHMLYIVLTGLCLLSSCVEPNVPGKPLVAFDLNGDFNNEGLASLSIVGNKQLSYATVSKDTCLDLSVGAVKRNPVEIRFNDVFSLEDYNGFTISVWVKKYADDEHKYTIISQESMDSVGEVNGWRLIARENGSWGWQWKDGEKQWLYEPTSQRQPIDEGHWHHLAFSYNHKKKESRLYYDGTNVAIYSMWGNEITIKNKPLIIGVDAEAEDVKFDLFNGYVNDLAMWSRVLNADEVHSLYRIKEGHWTRRTREKKELTVMTWNIWHGGLHDGKFVGLQKVISVIKEVDPDIIMLQETYGSGEEIADALGYYFYLRSSNLSLLSRYPIKEAHNVFRPFNFGCAEVQVSKDKSLLACPVWLHYLPNTEAYVKSGEAHVDSIVAREELTRGKETRFIVSEMRHSAMKSEQKPILLGGDFNSGSHLDWTEKNKQNYHNLVVPFPVTTKLEEAGYKDVFRQVFPDETSNLGQTWSPRFSNSLKNRIDYIFYQGEDLIPVNSYVIDNHSLGFPSDHAAVVAVFQWKN